MEKIYEFVTSAGKLSEKHFTELNINRGFSKETIKKCRFFSGGKYLIDIEQQMLKDFETQLLIRSGVFILQDGADKPTMSPQLLDERIIIPYLDIDGKACFLRPHKMGLSGVPVQIYHEQIFNFDDKSHAILTESEFKSAAAMQMGIKSIGIPGISSFSGDHFKRLLEFLNKGKIKQICIIFDNEIKNDPTLPNYKDKPINRYDTEYYAFVMAKMLFNEGIDARIGRLPDSWRVSGKIDIDGALAAGKTGDDLKWVISTSKPHKVYFDELPKEAKEIVYKKIQKKYHRSNIHISFNKYIATRWQGKKEYEEEISNFIIKILATHETSEGMIREAVMVAHDGKYSKSFGLNAEMMADNGAFRKMAYGIGNYVWKGRLEDLALIWEEQFFDDDGRVIVEPDHIGFIKREKIFLFRNVAIHSETGEEYRPDNDGIYWLGDRGYKPVSISTGVKEEVGEGIPALNLSKFEIDLFKQNMSDTIGKYESMIVFGWIGSFIFMEEIFGLYGCYPFLFLVGKKGSGKSTIGEWIYKIFGIESGARMISDTTTVAVQRLMGYYSCLPLYLDEFRNNKIVAPKVGMMRNVYNRQSAGKGTKESFGIREGRIRGGLMIAGEETPEDNALLSRCVTVNVSMINRKTDHYNWFMANQGKFSNIFYELIKKRKTIKETFIAALHDGKEFFVKCGLDDRMAIHYSIIANGYAAIFGEIPNDFMDYLSKETLNIKMDSDREQVINIFWDDILAFRSTGIINKSMWTVDDGKVYIYYHALYITWAQEFRKVRGTEPFKSGAIRSYLKEESGFLGVDFVKKINGYPRRCMVFELNSCSDYIKELVEAVT